MCDTGLQVGELVAAYADVLRKGKSVLYVPTEIQKDCPKHYVLREFAKAILSGTRGGGEGAKIVYSCAP